jgi:DNA-binding MarR family transcriptional regulator
MATKRSKASEPLIGGLLRLLSESVRDQILSDIEARGYTDIQRAHLSVFQFPSPHGASPSLLATRAHITKQSMNYLLGELEGRGYLERRHTAGDGRSRAIFLTPKGKRLVETMRSSVQAMEETWRQLVGRDRFGEMKSALMDIHASRSKNEGEI